MGLLARGTDENEDVSDPLESESKVFQTCVGAVEVEDVLKE